MRPSFGPLALCLDRLYGVRFGGGEVITSWGKLLSFINFHDMILRVKLSVYYFHRHNFVT